jgi:hypothetical protein
LPAREDDLEAPADRPAVSRADPMVGRGSRLEAVTVQRKACLVQRQDKPVAAAVVSGADLDRGIALDFNAITA